MMYNSDISLFIVLAFTLMFLHILRSATEQVYLSTYSQHFSMGKKLLQRETQKSSIIPSSSKDMPPTNSFQLAFNLKL